MNKRQTQYLNHLTVPITSPQDVEMKSCDNISDGSLTPHFSSENSSMSYEVSSQQSTGPTQYMQNTIQTEDDSEDAIMETDDNQNNNNQQQQYTQNAQGIASNNYQNNNDEKLYDQRATMLDHGFTPDRILSNTLQGCIWKVFYEKFKCDAIIKVTNKTLSNEGLGIDHRNGKYVSCKENIRSEIQMLHALNMTINDQQPPEGMIRLFNVFEDDFNYFVVQEHGGLDLLQFVNDCHVKIRNGKLLLSDWQITAKRMMKQIIEFVDWLHNV